MTRPVGKHNRPDQSSVGPAADAGALSGAAITWGARRASTRGPKPSLSIERIADAAIAVADEVGLDGLAMEAVSRRLGCSKMALYRYVPGKADLLDVVLHAALGPPPASIGANDDWRVALTRWAEALLARYGAHPWSVNVPVGGRPLTRNRALWLQAALDALRPTTLAMPEKLSLVLLVNGHVLFTAKLRCDAAIVSSVDASVAIDDPDLPDVLGVAQEGYLSDGGRSDDDFSWGLRCILRGVDGIGRRGCAGARPHRPPPGGPPRSA